MLLALIVALPLLGSLLPVLLDRRGRRLPAFAAALPAAIALLTLLSFTREMQAEQTIIVSYPWLESLGLNLSLRLDGLSFLFALLILGIGLLVILYSRYYLSTEEAMGRFYAYLLVFMSAMLGIVLSENLLLMLVFWEMTSLSSFLLISFWSHRSDSRRGARLALTFTAGGGLALLAGVLLLGHIAGSFELSQVLVSGSTIIQHPLYPLMLILILLGAFTKSAQFPFHFWLPHAMAAPTPVSAYLHSATMVKAGIFLLARLYPTIAGTDWWFYIVSLTGLTTLLLGSAMALFQHDLKGLLAYSTISHLGLITLLFGLDTDMSSVAAIFHTINHATFKASLFMAAGIIDHETGTRDLRRLSGLKRFLPHTALLAIVASLSMAGVPLLNGFLSKEMFLSETLNQGLLGRFNWIIPAVSTLANLLTMAYSVRFIHQTFFGEAPKDLPKHPHEPPFYMRLPVQILVLLCVVVGLFPGQTVSELLAMAARASLGRPLPEYSLEIWHGFNLPLLLSLIALVGGTLVYFFLSRPLFRLYEKLPDAEARDVFEGTMQCLVRSAVWFTDRLENGSLQRYLALMLLGVLLITGSALWRLETWTGPVALTPLDPLTSLGLLVLMAAAIMVALSHRHRLQAIIMSSVAGLMVAMLFARFSAPDLSLTQLSVEVVTAVLLVLALFFLPWHTPRESTALRRLRDLALAGGGGALVSVLTYAVLTRPYESISPFFLDNSLPGGGGRNVVNVILVDFRGFDTLGEISVLAITGVAIYAMLEGVTLPRPEKGLGGYSWVRDRHPLMLRVVSTLILPLALLVSVFIFMRGHNLPGGGFIAGLITTAALILQYIASGLRWTTARLPLDFRRLAGFGLLTAGITGLVAPLFGKPFLTSAFTHVEIPLIGDIELASAMLFDLGVYLTVVGSSLLILANLALNGRPQDKERI
ncbi:multisubunit potassium/proton antiporter, PhaA subunit (TC 2.A.63.1.1)/multisubunit potassium/proton antiporter, PhaB subunit (TC 2.A.63.1.1) [Pseudomonas duriflava]|uniref:Multisubunit potassium/proton antiporter, PhaA subunit (TC 2.A.63.1.1)/multisubunit potassium/proton antiporter, PhaB subunit (TC 2.A.63.1.1) n=1 Tax=Pseudomonas duriflava TaxID=459528 RepID=A0A562PUD0_9PSED|nr:monovalent cation/H+ antiporter subunit A [Pseudomonas duriflava]TWI48009.1 multisubunit potassium/proton antiporter, PhaA subunit (TC 2.A.63.1.1)/multisubunit potassium/proton antiporter, PhaB subunit (TC 2.A.63.1.1) [Pseudomonas duriflava]